MGEKEYLVVRGGAGVGLIEHVNDLRVIPKLVRLIPVRGGGESCTATQHTSRYLLLELGHSLFRFVLCATKTKKTVQTPRREAGRTIVELNER